MNVLKEGKIVVFPKTSNHYSHWKERKGWLTFRKLKTNFSVLLTSMQKLCKKLKQTQSKYFLSNIIPHNKTGFVEGRYIGERVRSIFDVMDLTLKDKKQNKNKKHSI